MARQPKIRVSYNSDAQYLLRLIHAIERDRTRPKAWREARIRELQDMAREFLNAPEPREAA